MTTHISLDASVVEDNNVQFIPCSIDYNGRAEVSSYFKDKTESNGSKISICLIYHHLRETFDPR